MQKITILGLAVAISMVHAPSSHALSMPISLSSIFRTIPGNARYHVLS